LNFVELYPEIHLR